MTKRPFMSMNPCLPFSVSMSAVEEELAPYGLEYFPAAEREFIRKLIEIFRCANDKAIMGIKINIDLFHYSSRQIKHKITEREIKRLLERPTG